MTPSISRTPIIRLPGRSAGVVDTIKARPQGGSTRGVGVVTGATRGSPHGGALPSITLGFDDGDLRFGSIRFNNLGHHNLGHHGHGRRGHSVFGHHGGLHGGLHSGLFDHSVYGQLYYDHRYHFYGPYRAYWSTAYYPHYPYLHGAGYYDYAPLGYYSYGSPYYVGAYEAAVYGQSAEVAEEPAPNDVQGVAVETTPGAAQQAPYGPAITGPPASSRTAEAGKPPTEGWGPLLGEGNVAFSQGRFHDARRIYARAMLIDERDGYAKMLFAWANFALGDYPLAATALRRALLTSPDLLKYPIDIRLHYGDLHTLDGQIESLKTYIAQNASDRDARLILGYLLYSVGDAEAALEIFTELSAADPDDQTVASLRESAQSVVKLLQDAPPANATPKPQ